MDVIQVLDSRSYFQSCLKTCSLRVCSPLSFGLWVDGWRVRYYIGSITDAYILYFVNDIDHTENKQCRKYKLSLSYHLNKLLSASVVFP